jgi:predicted signal transduction protein with EAL and GGDEF domain
LHEGRVAAFSIGTAYLDLDEFVIVKDSRCLGDNTVGQSVLAHANQRLERMSEASEILELAFGELHRGKSIRGDGKAASAAGWQGLKELE